MKRDTFELPTSFEWSWSESKHSCGLASLDLAGSRRNGQILVLTQTWPLISCDLVHIINLFQIQFP